MLLLIRLSFIFLRILLFWKCILLFHITWIHEKSLAFGILVLNITLVLTQGRCIAIWNNLSLYKGWAFAFWFELCIWTTWWFCIPPYIPYASKIIIHSWILAAHMYLHMHLEFILILFAGSCFIFLWMLLLLCCYSELLGFMKFWEFCVLLF